jgi:hypothetical protein
MLDYNIARDLVKLSADISAKSKYMARVIPGSAGNNWEQDQSTSDVLAEVAKKLDAIIAKYFVFYQLFHDEKLREAMSAQATAAIRREIKRTHADSR